MTWRLIISWSTNLMVHHSKQRSFDLKKSKIPPKVLDLSMVALHIMTPKDCPIFVFVCQRNKFPFCLISFFCVFEGFAFAFQKLPEVSRNIPETFQIIPKSSDPTSWGWSYVPFRRIWIHLNPKSSELRCFFLPTTLLKILFFLKESPATKLSSGMTSPNITNLSDFSSRNFRGTSSHPHLHRRTRPEKRRSEKRRHDCISFRCEGFLSTNMMDTLINLFVLGSWFRFSKEETLDDTIFFFLLERKSHLEISSIVSDIWFSTIWIFLLEKITKNPGDSKWPPTIP